MKIWETILFGALSSILASFIFWLLSFKWSTTNVIFSDKLEKSESASFPEKYRYRFRFSNYGTRDLIEILIKAKIVVNTGKKNHTFLNVGNSGFVPVLKRRKKNRLTAQIFSLYVGEEALNEFKKSFYKSEIREKAKSGKLSIEDIFTTYGEKVSITLFLFGNDSVTGARRIFVSKEYSINDVHNGIFLPLNEAHHNNRESAIKAISNIQSKSREENSRAD